MRYAFEDFLLDTETFTLTRNGAEVSVESRVLETLIYLIENRERVISKDELLEKVWEVDFASEATLFKAIQQARKALDDDGRAQRLIRTVHGKGYRLVGEVTEIRGETSPLSTPTHPAPDTPEPPDDPSEKPGKRRLPPIGRLLLAASVAIAAIALVRVVLIERLRSPTDSNRLSIAVLPCAPNPDLGPDRLWMTGAVPELLSLRLRSTGGLRVVGEDEVVEAVRDIGPERVLSGNHDRNVLFDRLDCDAAIIGRLTPSGAEGLTLEITIVRRDETDVESLSKSDPNGDLFALVGETGSALATRLGGETGDNRTWNPEIQPEAFAGYIEGLEAFRNGDLNRSVSILAPLVAQNRSFTPARITLARVYHAMGLKDAAAQEARTALEFSGDLPAETRLRLEALTFETEGRWNEAARVYRSLWSVSPDEADYPLSLIRALRWAGRTNEALDIGRRVADHLDDDPRLHLELSRVYQIQGRTTEQRNALERAVETARERGAKGRMASALLGLGWVDLSERRLDEAEDHFSTAEEIFRSIGNRRGEARCFKGRATVVNYGPDPAAALPLFERSARLSRDRGDFEDLGKTLYSITGLLAYLGETKKSLETGLETLEIARRAGDHEVEGAVLVRIGDARVDLGHPGEGLETYREALTVLEEQGASRRIAHLHNSMGLACEYTGDAASARRHFRTSANYFKSLGDSAAWFNPTYNLAWMLLRSGELDEARRLSDALRSTASDDSEKAAAAHLEAGIALEAGSFETALARVRQAIELRKQTGEHHALESSRELEMEIELAMGRIDQVSAAAERAVERLKEDGDPEATTAALLRAAEAAVEARRFDIADARIEQARRTISSDASPELRAQIEILSARVFSALGRFEEASASLELGRRIAERTGLAPLVMESEITEAELLDAQGRHTEARQDLEHLKRRCRRRGWGRLALRAASLNR